jgi:hypothetical protein
MDTPALMLGHNTTKQKENTGGRNDISAESAGLYKVGQTPK